MQVLQCYCPLDRCIYWDDTLPIHQLGRREWLRRVMRFKFENTIAIASILYKYVAYLV